MRIGKKGEEDIAPIEQVPAIGHGLRMREGKDVCIVAVGTVASEALKAAEQLAERGMVAEVVLAHTVKPIPLQMFGDILNRFEAVVTVEEHSRIGGFGEALLAYAAGCGMARRIEVLGTSDEFMPVVGSQGYARRYFGVDAEAVVQAANRVCSGG
jgi:transketolase